MDRLSELNDELLSAYLDGELSVEERAAVEARLLRDPEAQELVRELQAAGQAVRELPRVKAPHGLRDSILRAAAERMDSDDRNGEDSHASPAPVGPRSTWSIGRSPRGWMWGAAAVAAALLIMVLSGEGDRDRNVAQQAADREPRGQVQESIGRREVGDETAPVEDEGSRPPGEQDPRNLARTTSELRTTEELEERLGEKSFAEAMPEVERPTDAAQSDGAAPRDEALRRSDNSDSNFYDAQRLYFRDRFVRGRNDTSGDDAVVILDNVDFAFRPLAAADDAESPVYFVTVNVTPEAIRNSGVSKHFVNNSIALAGPPAAQPDVPQTAWLGIEPSVAGLEVTEPSAGLDGAASEPRGEGGTPPGAARETAEANVQRSNSLYTSPQTGAAAPAEHATQVPEVIAVEASAEQVAALLADLSADQENVRALAVLAQAQGTAAQEQETWDVPATLNRNADEALRQVAGTWRFEAANRPTVTANANGSLPGNAAYGGGYGGGYDGGYGRYGSSTIRGPGTSSELGDADAFGAEPQPDSARGGYGGAGNVPAETSDRADNVPAQAQADAASSGLATRSRRSELRRHVAASAPSAVERRAAPGGQAWVINRQHVRNSPPEPSRQIQERRVESEGQSAPLPAQPDGSLAAGGLRKLSAGDEAGNALHEDFGAQAPEPTAHPEERDPLGRNRAAGSEYRYADPPPAAGLGSRAESAPRASQPPSPSASGVAESLQGQPSQAGEPLVQTEAKSSPRQVRVLLFLNVVPPPPVAAAAATPQPSEAATPQD